MVRIGRDKLRMYFVCALFFISVSVMHSDTEGSFIAERARDMAEAAVEHVNKVVADTANAGLLVLIFAGAILLSLSISPCLSLYINRSLSFSLFLNRVHHRHIFHSYILNPEHMAAIQNFKTTSILEGIHLFRVHTYQEQIAIAHLLQGFCKEHPKVGLGWNYNFVVCFEKKK